MCEGIPYGPERKPWKDTVSPLAIMDKPGKTGSEITMFVTPPSQDPLNVYPNVDKDITPALYQVPSRGLSQEECHQAQEETIQHTLEQTANFLGYQTSLGENYDVVSKYLSTQVNNAGDPFVSGSCTLTT